MKRNLTLSTQGQELIYKLILTHRAIEKSINKFNQQHFQITAEQGFVLNIIEMRGKTTIEELAHLLLRELSTISSLISRMEKKGLVKKVLGNNGRVYTIKMTTKAKKIWNGDKVDQLIQGFISILSEGFVFWHHY
jgi:DNA-binding MarR family transcriptional regulator